MANGVTLEWKEERKWLGIFEAATLACLIGGMIGYPKCAATPTPGLGKLSVKINASPTSGDTPLLVHFSAQASGGLPPYTYEWIVFGGVLISGQSGEYPYVVPGAFPLEVLSRDALGQVASSSVTISVGMPPPPLSITLSASPTNGNAPLNVDFNSTVMGGVPPYTYSWSYGD